MVHVATDFEEKFFRRACGKRRREFFFDNSQPPLQVLQVQRARRFHEWRQFRKACERFFHARSEFRLTRVRGRLPPKGARHS